MWLFLPCIYVYLKVPLMEVAVLGSMLIFQRLNFEDLYKFTQTTAHAIYNMYGRKLITRDRQLQNYSTPYKLATPHNVSWGFTAICHG